MYTSAKCEEQRAHDIIIPNYITFAFSSPKINFIPRANPFFFPHCHTSLVTVLVML